ncbi:hypothetical protein [Parapedobacter sp. 10938]|uniref:hypothetical protein n=1 Tax=Parapedobacter flavus TaxID=3110225 RepID=UPI002DBF1631|nr:hypothetical protein [Parapedobacter sp. 10938]MEC3881684.1 hypothetical protein [Parapedobacter sp. 10938]
MKTIKMLFTVLGVVTFFTACNNTGNNQQNDSDTTHQSDSDTMYMEPVPPANDTDTM